MPWTLVKDILLTGTGVWLILGQAYSAHPSDVLLATGLALTVPSVAGHAKALLSSPTDGRYSPRWPPPGASPPGPPPEATGDQVAP